MVVRWQPTAVRILVTVVPCALCPSIVAISDFDRRLNRDIGNKMTFSCLFQSISRNYPCLKLYIYTLRSTFCSISD